METLLADDLREAVRDAYAKVAEGTVSGCCEEETGCCGSDDRGSASGRLGYSEAEMTSVPDGSNLGLGCGNPQAIADLKPGETVLDLGSGAGFDCFLASQAVGETGEVIGVDMTPEMIRKARGNAEKAGTENVTFRLGEIEHLPVADDSVDVILSNCVINLSPEKAQVFREAFRVLKPGGRLAISDIVATARLPEPVVEDLRMYTGCMAGAEAISDLEAMLEAVGFVDVQIQPKDESKAMIRDWAPGSRVEDYVVSATIEGVKG